MERQLPEYMIEDTSFYVDVDNRELREVGNPYNTISFENMTYRGDHYSFDYHLSGSDRPDLLVADPHNIIQVSIPEMVRLDPQGMAQKYNVPVDFLKDKSDFDIMVDQELLEQRLKGILPTIDIAGQPFIIDVRCDELQPRDGAMPILLKDLDYSIEEEQLRGFYDVSKRKLFDVDPAAINEIPQNVVMIQLPSEWALDPVGMARKNEREIFDALIKHPIHKDLKAKVIPIAQTNIPYLVRTNRERQQREQKNKPQALLLKKNHTKHNGRRL